jgi:hypothetical protein
LKQQKMPSELQLENMKKDWNSLVKAAFFLQKE